MQTNQYLYIISTFVVGYDGEVDKDPILSAYFANAYIVPYVFNRRYRYNDRPIYCLPLFVHVDFTISSAFVDDIGHNISIHT